MIKILYKSNIVKSIFAITLIMFGAKTAYSTNRPPHILLKLYIGPSNAWIDSMPRIIEPGENPQNRSGRKHIVIPVELQNGTGIDLPDVHVIKAEVLKDDKVIGSFHPVFQLQETCSEKLKGEKFLEKFNLLENCRLNFKLRNAGNSDKLPKLSGKIQIRFQFGSVDYISDVYTTEEITVETTY